MRFGHFDDANREYVVDRPDTPKSWSNYLGSTEYGAIITNNAGGYSFYQSTARGRFTRLHFNNIPLDQPGRYFYIRDNESADYWSASWQPVGKPLDQYKTTCRHGTAYTIIESQYSGITSESTYFVPLGKLFECWILKLTNTGRKARKLSVFTYVEFTNEWNVLQDMRNLQYTQYIGDTHFVGGRFIDAGCNTNFSPMELPGLRGGSKHTFLTPVGIDVAGFETDRETFLGPYRTYANPIVVETGKCSGTEAHGDNGCGCLKMDVNLKPGESREFMVIMGIGHAEKYGKQAVKEFSTVAKARKALEELKKHWHSRIGSYEVSSPDKELNSMVNVWNAYNALITFAWSRAASLIYAGERDGLGYRDTVQDILGVLNAIPDEARQRLELMIMGQVQCGGAMSVVKPFEHRPGHEQTPDDREYRSDDCLWLFNTVPAYVKETGDISFYDKVLPYADKGEATVFDHLRRALEFNIERSGAHGLPCGLAADWNDCLVLGFRGESLFVAFQVRYGLRTYIEIAQMLKRPAEVEWAKKQLAKLDAALDKVAWDGKWFIRAIREDGSIIGTKKDPEGSIFLNSQSWAVIAGAGTKEQAIQSMDSVKEMLATQYGIALCNPPFEKTDIQVVRAVLFNHSMKENGGIFCHPQSWAIIAETMLGRGNRAYEYLRAYLPAAYNERAEIRQIEPYVHGQSTHGKYSRHHGATRLPWLSGTVAWTYHTMTQYILGIRPEYEGLLVDPCVPSDWKTFSVSRRFRGATYQITVKNNGVEKGVKSIRVDGKEVPANKPLPLAAAGKTVKVEVTMGR